jgi:hypothetical protein
MSLLSKTYWLKRLAVVLVTVVSIGALTVPTAPTNAQVFVGFGVGAPVGWGYYPPPPPYYAYYRYSYYYRPYYPAYYGYPGVFVGATFGPRHHHHHHHHWR